MSARIKIIHTVVSMLIVVTVVLSLYLVIQIISLMSKSLSSLLRVAFLLLMGQEEKYIRAWHQLFTNGPSQVWTRLSGVFAMWLHNLTEKAFDDQATIQLKSCKIHLQTRTNPIRLGVATAHPKVRRFRLYMRLSTVQDLVF